MLARFKVIAINRRRGLKTAGSQAVLMANPAHGKSVVLGNLYLEPCKPLGNKARKMR